MSDKPVHLPVPSGGGSYLRDDATGELVRIEGPDDDRLPPPVDDVAAETAPETPAEEK